MPIYEYRCNSCSRRLSLFQRQMNSPADAVCPHCGGTDLIRLISRFAVVRNEDQMLDSLEDEAMFAGVDETDPKSMAAWARKMQSKMGEEVEPEFEEMIDRMEAGEMPDELDDDSAGADDLDL
jgi:putative FmdB family regulatory protein